MEIRSGAMSESNILSGWRKSGICPINRLIPLSSHFVKDPNARERSGPIISSPNTPILAVVVRNNAEESERSGRLRIRELEQQNREKDAEIARLKAELKFANEALALTATTKKRKIAKSKVDSNEKLVSFEFILDTQAAVDLEEEEERKRAERRAKKQKRRQKTLKMLFINVF